MQVWIDSHISSEVRQSFRALWEVHREGILWGSGETERSPQKPRELCCSLFPCHFPPQPLWSSTVPFLSSWRLLSLRGKHTPSDLWSFASSFPEERTGPNTVLILAKRFFKPEEITASPCFYLLAGLLFSYFIYTVMLPFSRAALLYLGGPSLWIITFISSLIRCVSLVYWILASEHFSWLKCPIHHWRFCFSL